MPIPEFNEVGNLPAGVYEITLDELFVRFEGPSQQRRSVSDRIRRILGLAKSTNKLSSVLIFGSYVTNKTDPNDVDMILIMQDDFRPETFSDEVSALFDHSRAKTELGADVFWIRPGLLILDTLDAFKQRWQLTREGDYRGIIEVRP